MKTLGVDPSVIRQAALDAQDGQYMVGKDWMEGRGEGGERRKGREGNNVQLFSDLFGCCCCC